MSNSWPQYPYSAISRKLLELVTSNLVCSFVSGMSSGRTNNFPWKWVWPRSRDPYNFGIWSNISPKLLELETSNLACGFELGMLKTRTNNYPESGRGLGHVAPTISIDWFRRRALACAQHRSIPTHDTGKVGKQINILWSIAVFLSVKSVAYSCSDYWYWMTIQS